MQAIDVVGHGQQPLVLVVAAYEPILWNVSAVKDRVRAVVASGFYPQAITGVGRATPMRFSSSVGSFDGSNTCAHIGYAYGDTAGIQGMANEIRRAIGAPPLAFYGNVNADRLDVDGPDAGTANRPDLGDIHASVPLITQDDPASGARMTSLPGEGDSSGPIPRVVEWDDAGKIVRDQGGPPEIRPADTSGTARTQAVPSDAARSLLRSFLWLGLLALGYWLWRRPRKAARRRAAPAPSTASPILSVPTASGDAICLGTRAVPARIAELTALAAMTDCDALVVALHRFGREIHSVSKAGFDADIADEIGAILERHFDHAVERYRQVRPSLIGDEGAKADAALAHSVERLVARLQELQGSQHRRDLDSVNEAARFIDARHPA